MPANNNTKQLPILITDGGTSTASAPDKRYKIGRLITSYDLDELGEELEARWTGATGERESLRDLATYFNKRLLESVLDDHDIRPLAGDVEATYRALTNDETSSGVRSELRNRLRRTGVDLEQLESDFVTHQAIYTYLTDSRGVTLENDISADVRIEKETEALQRLRSRTAVVTEDAVDRLASRGLIEIGDFDVIIDTSVVCRDCGEAYPPDRLFERGHCECRARSD